MDIEDIKAQAFVEGYEAEQLRLKAIMTSDAAKTRMKLAWHLAFGTNYAADDAVALLMAAAEETPAVTPQKDMEAAYVREMTEAGTLGLGPAENQTHSSWAAAVEKTNANLEAMYGKDAVKKGDE